MPACHAAFLPARSVCMNVSEPGKVDATSPSTKFEVTMGAGHAFGKNAAGPELINERERAYGIRPETGPPRERSPNVAPPAGALIPVQSGFESMASPISPSLIRNGHNGSRLMRVIAAPTPAGPKPAELATIAT